MPGESQRALSPEGNDVTHMVPSVILNQAAVAEKYELKKSACSRLPADPYIRLSLPRSDGTSVRSGCGPC